ncbi:hypothetical protein CC78DRAFT_570550 [Lojkania enalia]|uniref:Yeast cell wall synthesis Kre9/Knh1-like N-terminal domain-containing protein n=1 Tax=Lojkania enalia TaxID=147567 RepID=A0A9P4K5N9_9PLEO|nr:hypothetical protein CC78DRAFT_570550 [Didymosphaeria enalia]
MFGKFSAIAVLAGLAAAFHEPVEPPSGNPITAPMNEVIEAGTTYTIEWDPTTPNTVSLLLYSGPATNLQLDQVLVEGIENSGSFVWDVPSDLGVPDSDATGYGIRLIDDVNGQYQWSTPFGIEGEGIVVSSSVSSGYSASTPVPTSESTTSMVYNTTSIVTSHYTASTGYPVSNSSILYPTKSMSVPSTLKPTASSTTGTAPPQVSDNAASSLNAGLGLTGALVAAIFML